MVVLLSDGSGNSEVGDGFGEPWVGIATEAFMTLAPHKIEGPTRVCEAGIARL
jgi:hypothetical protein